jgi:drug/metabolite transporter (DMT)-like permease
MVVAMAGFALEDVLFKQLAATLPVGELVALVGVGGGCIFSVMAKLSGRSLLSRHLLYRPLLVRNLSEGAGSVFFVSALALSTLSGVSAILQATPLAVTLGAALFLGEAVGWRRWTAIGIGFLGVLCIVQPGSAAFEPAPLFAVASVFLLAVRDLSSRAVPADIASTQVAAWGFLSTVPAGLFLLAVTGTRPAMPDHLELLRLAGILIVGGIGYYSLIAATRIGEVSAVVPFRYTRLVFGLTLGHFVFGERPDTLMLTGAALIVGTGLYTIWRSAIRRARPA